MKAPEDVITPPALDRRPKDRRGIDRDRVPLKIVSSPSVPPGVMVYVPATDDGRWIDPDGFYRC